MIRRARGLLLLACLLSLTLTRRAAADEQTAEKDAPWTQARWFGPWQFELNFTGTSGFGEKGIIYGGGLGVSLRHVTEFNRKAIVSVDEEFGVVLAILTAGVTAAPVGMWMGNEWGFDLHAKVLQTSPKNGLPEQRLAIGIAPSFRITRKCSRLRFPAFLPTFVPELGVGLVPNRAPEVLVQFHPFSMGFLVSDHVAIDLDPTVMIAIPTDKNKTEVWALQSVSIALR